MGKTTIGKGRPGMKQFNHFIFDVDGTLTPSRGKIDPGFNHFLLEFAKRNRMYLVTGSDKPKTVEQVGEDLYNSCHTVYNCSGNDVWQSNKNVYTNDWTLPKPANKWLKQQLDDSNFELRTGLHFEHRTGMVNFSIVGRNASKEERAEYVKWDNKSNERKQIAREFNKLFPKLKARPGAETGIDIYPSKCDGSQIMRDFYARDVLYFFGDRMDPQGNDYPLAQMICSGAPIAVDSWKDTYDKLLMLRVLGIAK